jgi:hypothetical protein
VTLKDDQMQSSLHFVACMVKDPPTYTMEVRTEMCIGLLIV